jgi:hypothetical protein
MIIFPSHLRLYNLHNLNTFLANFCYGDQINEGGWMTWARKGKMRNEYEILVRRPEGKTSALLGG